MSGLQRRRVATSGGTGALKVKGNVKASISEVRFTLLWVSSGQAAAAPLKTHRPKERRPPWPVRIFSLRRAEEVRPVSSQNAAAMNARLGVPTRPRSQGH